MIRFIVGIFVILLSLPVALFAQVVERVQIEGDSYRILISSIHTEGMEEAFDVGVVVIEADPSHGPHETFALIEAIHRRHSEISDGIEAMTYAIIHSAEGVATSQLEWWGDGTRALFQEGLQSLHLTSVQVSNPVSLSYQPPSRRDDPIVQRQMQIIDTVRAHADLHFPERHDSSPVFLLPVGSQNAHLAEINDAASWMGTAALRGSSSATGVTLAVAFSGADLTTAIPPALFAFLASSVLGFKAEDVGKILTSWGWMKLPEAVPAPESYRRLESRVGPRAEPVVETYALEWVLLSMLYGTMYLSGAAPTPESGQEFIVGSGVDAALSFLRAFPVGMMINEQAGRMRAAEPWNRRHHTQRQMLGLALTGGLLMTLVNSLKGMGNPIGDVLDIAILGTAWPMYLLGPKRTLSLCQSSLAYAGRALRSLPSVLRRRP